MLHMHALAQARPTMLYILLVSLFPVWWCGRASGYMHTTKQEKASGFVMSRHFLITFPELVLNCPRNPEVGWPVCAAVWPGAARRRPDPPDYAHSPSAIQCELSIFSQTPPITWRGSTATSIPSNPLLTSRMSWRSRRNCPS